ncbi:MAG: valyl-tRNA synthetase [Candidatus Adlerbacteria bacterium]|nr:valyl-tRNA synthetase [Candidatus Adlerbacteria bacterium]
MPEKFLKPYDAQASEASIYKTWEESGYFNPDNLPPLQDGSARTEPFSIVLPPPNVTGTLHLGHASMLAVEDILVRYNRMKGKKALWIPGTDSAAIATQSKVEKEIQKSEGKSRHDLGRDELLKRVDAFAEESKTTIVNQVKRMGSSLDWSRYAYTLDDKRYKAVMEAFVRMYDAGLIYRGNRIVNWDPKGQTTISDDEIVHEERTAKLVTFKYSKDFPIAVSTTRLETKVGDTAVAVHPDDARYQEFVGKEYDATFCGVPLHIKIIADKEVDPEFGTGALGVTPAHSQTDWEIADRHNIAARPQVINEYAKMTVEGPLSGKKVLEARETVLEWLKTEGLFIEEKDIQQNVSTAERTGGIIEPLPKLQWFIDVNKPIAERGDKSLKELMREAVASGGVMITPSHFEKIYFHWIENLRDWCISRQIWFGHRIPVWYKGTETYVGIEAPEGEGWGQDQDTLDTWFSSGLWTFSTLGWPEETEDLKTFHPTSVLETGYDILFFWVARMILMSSFLMKEVPFKNVYLHGLVRDGQGRKMSKSLGNIIDPLDMINKYGADAVRLSLIVGAAPGNDIRLDENRIRAYKNFANKVWNITRFVLESAQEADAIVDSPINPADESLIAEAKVMAQEVAKHIDTFRLDLAADAAYQFIWHRFADEVLEESKPLLRGDDKVRAASRAAALLQSLDILLKALHPFMPFVTEEIWKDMPSRKDLLMVEAWPS